jgi:N-acetylglucosamine-6-sulfatase
LPAMRLVLGMLCALMVTGCGEAERPAQLPIPTPAASAPVTPAPNYDVAHPNIVFVLTDDLSGDLLRFMPNVQKLAATGATFDDYFVSDSLCCPSRASIFTGLLPHDTGVYTNTRPDGGIRAYRRHGDAQRSFALTLAAQGYRTALMGKYLNGYGANGAQVPPGWSDWAGTSRAYQGFDYTLNVDGTPYYYGSEPQDYLTDVISERGGTFIDSSAARARPFFLELASFTPHRPAVPAPRDLGLFGGVRAPRGPAFNRAIVDAPPWLAGRGPLSLGQRDRIDSLYRDRARSVVAVDDMVGALIDHLRATGQLDNTYFVFSSDNGFHMGEHRLQPGKLTAFDTDIRVPLIVSGPGVAPGTHIRALAQNTDLAPTFETLAGAQPPADVDGRSLTGLLHGDPVPADWRTATLVEHRHITRRHGFDPDVQTRASGDPPSYTALRTAGATYVEYADGERELYDDRFDPDQLRNAYGALTISQRGALHRELRRLVNCHGTASCATAPAPRAGRAARRHRRRARRH